jgi:cobalt-zinc-cadmium efflux system membrane fusion protein
LLHIKEGQAVRITSRGIAGPEEGKVVFISPMVDKETRSTRVVAEVGNDKGIWRLGQFVTAAVIIEEQSVPLAIPANAVQTMAGAKVVFVRGAEGFERREVVLGRSDDRLSEVVSGLRPGEVIAGGNTFLLKAEFMKPSADD